MYRILYFFGYRKPRGPNTTASAAGDGDYYPSFPVPELQLQGQSPIEEGQGILVPNTPGPMVAGPRPMDSPSIQLTENPLSDLRRLNQLFNPLVKKRKTINEDNGLLLPQIGDKPASVMSIEKSIGVDLVDNLKNLDVVQDGLNHFLSGGGPFIKILDDVAKIHPAVTVAVLAFKAVWTLETTRRENDKRIIALYISMRDMMGVLHRWDYFLVNIENHSIESIRYVLYRLQDISKKKAERRGEKVKDIFGFSLKDISEKAALDMKKCGSACDLYGKKRLVIKVLNSTFWQSTFTEFLRKFAQHRQDFEFALTIHIAGAVEESINYQQKHAAALAQLDDKLTSMSEMLRRFATPEETDIAMFIEKKGGVKTIAQQIKENNPKSDAVLKELDEYENEKYNTTQGTQGGKIRHPHDSLEELRKEINIDQDQALKKNFESFQLKFEAQQKLFRDEVTQVVRKEGENIIRTLTAGSYSRILNEDVQAVWKEMKWGGNVKARHFVLALHDYFTEKWGLDVPEQPKEALTFKYPLRAFRPAKKGETDEWALGYLDPANLQTLSEAFDADASGFITIKEVNEFTGSMPEGWSLPHWIAYWAIGWQLTLDHNKEACQEILARMLRTLPSVRPENRDAANQYFETMSQCILPLLASVNPVEEDEILFEKFEKYNKQEEQALKARLKEEAEESIVVISQAVSDRVKRLKAIFVQQKLRVNESFHVFANGIFEYISEASKFWSAETILRTDLLSVSYFHFKEEPNDLEDPTQFCNHEVQLPIKVAPLHDALVKAYGNEVPPLPFSLFEGEWNGYFYNDDHKISIQLLSFSFVSDNQGEAGSTEPVEIEVEGSLIAAAKEFQVKGKDIMRHNQNLIEFAELKCTGNYGLSELTGHINPQTRMMTGTVSLHSPGSLTTTSCTLYMEQRTLSTASFDRFHPPASEFQTSKPRALWKFALDAVMAEVSQKFTFTRRYFAERRKTRQTYLDLMLERRLGRILEHEEYEVLWSLRSSFSKADAEFYDFLVKYMLSMRTRHCGYTCDNCQRTIYGSRTFCITCLESAIDMNTVDFCDRVDCINSQGVYDREDILTPHVPSHTLVKTRRVVFRVMLGKVVKDAKAAKDKVDKRIQQNIVLQQNKMKSRKEAPDRNAVITCCFCGEIISEEFWICIECNNPTCICTKCDSNGRTALLETYEGSHNYQEHVLVKWQMPPQHTVLTIEERLTRMERELTDRLSKLETFFQDHIHKVDRLLESPPGTSSVNNGFNGSHGWTAI
ncbi:hypothetical protein M422DRAFT_254828 [Sphaerobolus stellatus SS14]|uniref:EF-hand domain-containing protein n=1 Tax=Sphaerobolus stellatus (strain SS14) TaxID=990650 RepID=A0A0C9V5E8_SPHS4|nr:hypothetical protein M422DRAFT_254828 [Sphaerobolus stellatus SS14]